MISESSSGKDEPQLCSSSSCSSSSSFSRLETELSLSSSSLKEDALSLEQYAKCSLSKMESYLLSGRLTDVILIAGSKRIAAHRLVLSAGSPYFAAMFTGSMKESKEETVELKNVDGECLWAVVRFLYSGTIDLRNDNVEAVMQTACLLQLNQVVDACSKFMIKQLQPSNCIGVHLFADMQSCQTLMKASLDYILEHFTEITQHEEFIRLPPDEVKKILNSDDLNVPNEEVVFHALTSWVNHNEENRRKDLGDLLRTIRLPLLSPEFIIDKIENNPLFVSDDLCRKLVIEALTYHLLPLQQPLLQSIRTRPRKSTVGTMYVIGGYSTSSGLTSIEKYNVRTNTWHYVGNVWSNRLQYATALLKGQLYVVGGREGLKTLSSVECYDFLSKTWVTAPPMKTQRHGLGAAVLEGCLYAVGGHDGWSYLNNVERWDPEACRWSYVASLSRHRSTVGVACLDNRLYAVGGRDGNSCLNIVEQYNPFTNNWKLMEPMQMNRGGVALGVANGFLYALGGHDAPREQSRFSCVERYNPKTNTWTMVASLSMGRDAIGVCLLGHQLFAVGGYDGEQYVNIVEAYDTQTNEWHIMAPVSSGRARSCIVINDENFKTE